MVSTSASLINRLVFMGTPEFAVPALKRLAESKFKPVLVVTQPDRPKGRKQRLTPPPVKALAFELGISVFQPEDVNTPDAIEQIAAVKPDVIVTAAYGGFLGKALRELTPFGCLNLHPSLLPLYRGSSPVNAALFHGDTITGNTIFRLTRRMDAGPILYQRQTDIEPTECYTELQDRLSLMGGEDLVTTLEMLERGEIVEQKQQHEKAVFCGKIDKSDTFIDWNVSAETIRNHVRGLALQPGATAFLREAPIKIIRTELLERIATDEPGTIVGIVKNVGFEVATADRVILITEVQPAGKKIMSAHAYNLGAHLKEGERFTHADRDRD